jgi:hypothetical protein
MEGNLRVGLRLAAGASPMPPTTAAERSVKMSPNRLLATTTSKLSGRRTKFMHAASTSMELVFTSGKSPATAWKTSSQKTMLWAMALDLVMEVRCFFRERACSKAKRMIRSVPRRVKTLV